MPPAQQVRKAGAPKGTGPTPTNTENSATARLQVPVQRNSERRQKPASTHVLVPSPVWVVAANGNSRVLLPWRCLTCGATHLSQGRGEIPPTVNRRGPHGRIVLHIAAAAVAG